MSSSTTVPEQPSFDDLPLRRPGPPLNAWGLYGDDDELGRLNLITPEADKRGIEAAKSGRVVNLNLPLDQPVLNPARGQLEHTINHRVHCNDDILTFNTQCSTQWDGFRHYAYRDYPHEGEYTYYNGMTSEEAKDKNNHRLGTQNYVKHPITSRAHLLDIPAYLSRHNLPPLSYFDTSTPIPLSTLKACAAEANITFAPGDILVVRIGWTEALEALSQKDQENLAKREVRGFAGVDQAEQSLRWHWENGIAAVVTDGVAYEAMPSPRAPSMHETFLSGWGLPIGELFDLRELAKACEERQNWSFLFTSMPLYVNGGIASPPNAQAIL